MVLQMPTLLNTFDSSAATGEGIGANYVQKIIIEAGTLLVPIGTIVPWLKSFTAVPTLAAQGFNTMFLECNGTVIDDPDSPLNGQTLPNLNGSNQFPRGNSTSGGTSAGGHTHTITSTAPGGTRASGSGTIGAGDNHTHGMSSEVCTPPYYNVVWIMRVK